MPKIVFMGTPDFAMESLKALVESGYNVDGVVTKVDRPKGRGMKMVASPVKEYALEKEIKVYQPEKVKGNKEFYEELKQLNPDIIVVVAYGKILPKEILDLPKLGCINVHGSLLPQYRGAAPIQWSVIKGDKKTGVTTMYMNEGMDTGDMILKEEVEIGEDETTGELWDRLAKIGANLLVKTIKEIENGTAKRETQTGEFSTAPMLTKDMAKINWEEYTASRIHNLVRGLNPIMGAYSFLDDKKVKFWKIKIVEEEEFCNDKKINCARILNSVPGTIIYANDKDGLFIKTVDGIISVLEIQVENSKRMGILDFLRGNKMPEFQMFR